MVAISKCGTGCGMIHVSAVIAKVSLFSMLRPLERPTVLGVLAIDRKNHALFRQSHTSLKPAVSSIKKLAFLLSARGILNPLQRSVRQSLLGDMEEAATAKTPSITSLQRISGHVCLWWIILFFNALIVSSCEECTI